MCYGPASVTRTWSCWRGEKETMEMYVDFDEEKNMSWRFTLRDNQCQSVTCYAFASVVSRWEG